MNQYFIIHYSEIGLKGKNRNFFEDKLIFHIKRFLARENFGFIKKISGRVILKLNEKSNAAKISEKLKKVFGIVYFCEAFESSQNLEVLKKDVVGLMRGEIPRLVVSLLARDDSDKIRVTFKIETKRSNKSYPFTSQQINEKVGEHVFENIKQGVTEIARSIDEASFATPLRRAVLLQVDLKNPGITCFIEIVEKYAFIYFKKIKGAGGMPTGTSGKIVSLISSGFDSPVAAYFLMRRGAEIIFVHFESTPQTSSASIENVRELVKKLTEYQLKSKLYLIPFLEIQKEIIAKCELNLAVVLYRRIMVLLAQEIAKKENARALVTGDNLGQVASQTLENIEVVNNVAQMPIFRPLIGFDKEQIIEQARKISTYEISSQPYEDCCSLFVPRHPQTRARIGEVEDEEKKIDVKQLTGAVAEKAKIEEISL